MLCSSSSRASIRSTAAALSRAASTSAPVASTVAPHFKSRSVLGKHTKNTEDDYLMSHQIYTPEEVAGVEVTHRPTTSRVDKMAFGAINLLRGTFDMITGYDASKPFAADKYLTRMIFLESVAGCPGLVGAACRHLKSLRTLKRDNGFIHTLLEEAENERMHLLTFVQLRNPGILFRSAVILTQGIFFNFYFAAYLASPKFCHRLVGYLEEEAVKTYTHIIEDIDSGAEPSMKEWQTLPCPEIGKKYWRLADNATMRDLILAVRADERNHREVNHQLADLPEDASNPFL
jgi:Alternative oxidase